MSAKPLRTIAAMCVALMPLRGLAAENSACVAAGAEVERRRQLPPGLLLAIGQVESGRRDPATGRVVPWPWTIDAAGTGQHFADLSSALAETARLQAGGVASIDVGCFQINLAAHRQAFDRLEEAFDPASNADYAGRFLLSLYQRLGSWPQAIATYHSATPERGAAYRDLVMAAWGPGLPRQLLDTKAPVPTLPVQVVSWVPAQGGIRIWLPSGLAAPSVIRLPGAPHLPTVRTASDTR